MVTFGKLHAAVQLAERRLVTKPSVMVSILLFQTSAAAMPQSCILGAGTELLTSIRPHAVTARVALQMTHAEARLRRKHSRKKA